MHVHFHMHVHGIQKNQDPDRHKRGITNKTKQSKETEIQGQIKQVKQKLEHINKMRKVNKSELGFLGRSMRAHT